MVGPAVGAGGCFEHDGPQTTVFTSQLHALPSELGQLEALERRGLERQQQGKVRRKEQHLAARTRQEQAAAEAACHPRSVPPQHATGLASRCALLASCVRA